MSICEKCIHNTVCGAEDEDMIQCMFFLKEDEKKSIVCAHWIYKPMDTDVDIWLYHCSACANLSARPRVYCAECGAKMEEKVEHYDG